jgi:hypothetical protein
MIDWTDELMAQIGTFSRAALSYPGLDGYPVALPLPFTFDAVEHRFTLPMPAHRPAILQEDHASLTLLRYDSQMANERYLLFYGQLTELGNNWALTPSRVVMR